MLQCGRCCEATYCSEACQAKAFPKHNVTCCKPPHPVCVVLMSLEKTERFDEKHSTLLIELRDRADLREITAPRATIDFLFARRNLRIPVIVTDAAFARKGRTAFELREAAAAFVYGGGVVLFSCDVPTFTSPADMNDLFASFDKDWRCAIYPLNTFTMKDLYRVAFSVNAHTACTDVARLTETYAQEAIQVDMSQTTKRYITLALNSGCIGSSIVESLWDLTRQPRLRLDDSGKDG